MLDTLYHARTDLCSLGIVAFIVIVMLAMMGNLTLGGIHRGLSTFSGAVEVMIFVWITGDLAGIIKAVQARGVDQNPLMDLAGQLFFKATWFLLFACLLNFLFGILAMWFQHARFTNQGKGQSRDILEDLQAMLGLSRRRRKIVKLLRNMRLSVSDRSSKLQQHEMVLMKIRGIWVRDQLLQQGAVEDACAMCAPVPVGKSAMMNYRMKAVMVSERVCENLSNDVNITGTAAQLRDTRILLQARALARAVKTVREITQTVQLSLLELRVASAEQMAMSHHLQQVARQPEQHFQRSRLLGSANETSSSFGSYSKYHSGVSKMSSFRSTALVMDEVEIEPLPEEVFPDPSLSRRYACSRGSIKEASWTSSTVSMAWRDNQQAEYDFAIASSSHANTVTSLMQHELLGVSGSISDESSRAMLVRPVEQSVMSIGDFGETAFSSMEKVSNGVDELYIYGSSVEELPLKDIPGSVVEAREVTSSNRCKELSDLSARGGSNGRLHTAPSESRRSHEAVRPKMIVTPFL